MTGAGVGISEVVLSLIDELEFYLCQFILTRFCGISCFLFLVLIGSFLSRLETRF